MLADKLDHVVGVDPHRDLRAVAVLHVLSGAVVFETAVVASSKGYADALKSLTRTLRGGARSPLKKPVVRCRSDALPERPR